VLQMWRRHRTGQAKINSAIVGVCRKERWMGHRDGSSGELRDLPRYSPLSFWLYFDHERYLAAVRRILCLIAFRRDPLGATALQFNS
jgi:hypothetical protein